MTLRIGPLSVDPPVVLAPMAGVTDAPFRGVCSRFGAGLYVSEMITARALVERNARTLSMLRFDGSETTRSVQLYGTDPRTIGEAVRYLIDEVGVDHVDMNFGCPVPKVTRKGGGSALPVRRALLRAIVRSAVAAAGTVPVTIKFRMGVDDSLLTFLDTGRIAEDEGVAAIALHARTAEQLYSGAARWEAIAALKAHVTTIPVLGNGDIMEAHDALAMLATTGCDGVVVGRGCLGRPWLFRDLVDAFAGRPVQPPPLLGEVCDGDARPRRAPGGVERRGRRHEVVPQARRLVPHRLPRRRRREEAGQRRRHPRRPRPPHRASSTPTPRSATTPSAPRGATPTAPDRSTSPRAGSSTETTPPRRRAPSSSSAAARHDAEPVVLSHVSILRTTSLG